MVTQSDEELSSIFAERYNHKRQLGIGVGDRGGSVENDIQSGFAEVAVARFLGCDINLEITDGGDDGCDVLFKGKRIDVKWMGWLAGTRTPRTSGRIIVDIDKLTADIYVAVSGTTDTGFKILGWCSKDDLLNNDIWLSSHRDGKGRYERYAMHSRDLKPLERNQTF